MRREQENETARVEHSSVPGMVSSRCRSIKASEVQRLSRVVLADVRVNVLGELGELVAVRALVLGRHAALMA